MSLAADQTVERLAGIVVDAVRVLSRGFLVGAVGVAQRAVGPLLLADVMAKLFGLIEQILLSRRQLMDGEHQKPRGGQAVDRKRGQGGVAHLRIFGIGRGFTEQNEDRLRGADGVASLTGKARGTGQGKGGPDLTQVVIALHGRLESRQKAVDKSALLAVGSIQPFRAALGAQRHLLLQGRKFG